MYQRKKYTTCQPDSINIVQLKNGRFALKCKCESCGINKFRFISNKEIQGGGFDELIVKGLAAGAEGLYNLGKLGASKAIKSDFVRNKIKNVSKKYLDQAVDSITDDISDKISGKGIDIHKAIGKLPRPKGGFTLPGHRYSGPYNPLEKQVKWNPKTGEIFEIYDQPSGPTDAIAMVHDVDYAVCKDDKACKHRADDKMVKALDSVPWNERQWGHFLARNAINTKRKLGLGKKKH